VIQALVECSQEVRESFARSTVEEPDRWHRRLLRACRERPRGRRAAEQRDEIASSHAGHGGVLRSLCANEGHGCTVGSPRIQGITERTAGPWATPEMF